MKKQNLCKKYYCLLIQYNSNNNYYVLRLTQKLGDPKKNHHLKNKNHGNKPILLLKSPNDDICFQCSQIPLKRKPKIRRHRLLRIATAIITTLLTNLAPVNQEKLDTQTQTMEIIKNYATMTRIILEFYDK
ncbi:MAG: hypothetical protein MGG37_22860 [Trichodesmium sp. MAG_R01]|nr:hypothetical protein [Trichodesmium sp. MAG_R01]